MKRMWNYYSNVIGYRSIIPLFIILLLLAGCQQNSKKSSKDSNQPEIKLPSADGDYFQEIGLAAGLDFIHTIGAEHLTNIIESSGGGASFLDFDQDGHIDLYLSNGTWIEGFSQAEKPEIMAENHLYRNMGDGTFEDVTKKAGANDPAYSMGASVGDYNNDGYPDIYFVIMSQHSYKNNETGLSQTLPTCHGCRW
jgi:hypothetical protein